MEFQTLRKSHNKQIIMGALAVCAIGGALTFATTRAKYKVTQDIKLVNGTVNYKVPDLRVVAVNISEDGNNYTNTNNIPTNGYTINSSKSICKVYDGTTSLENAPKDNNIKIEYNNSKINILGVSKKNTRCYLYFDKKKEPTASETILANITPKDETPTFTNAATTDEGVYSASDGMYGGISYYWRGAVTNNYAKFANKCWRIVRINGDGSIRLIYDGTSCHANGTPTSDSITLTKQKYNASSNNSSYVGWTYTVGSQRPSNNEKATASNAKSQTESWYNSNIGNNTIYSSKVSDGKFCNDRSVGSGSWSATGSAFYYGAYSRLNTSKTPILECPSEDVYTLKIGAITADEVAYAGGVYGTSNSSYYLYNGQAYWSISPYFWIGASDWTSVFTITSNGSLSGNYDVSHTTPGLRPVINLNSDITFSSGNGTQNNPYVVS